MQEFTKILDQELGHENAYYLCEREETGVLGSPLIVPVPEGTFYSWLKSKNKLGGQHKVPKLSNDRKIIEDLLQYVKK